MIKPNFYPQAISKDYIKLYELLIEKKLEIVCIVNYEHYKDNCHRDICVARVSERGNISMDARGICYGDTYHHVDEADRRKQFLTLCERLNLDWLDRNALGQIPSAKKISPYLSEMSLIKDIEGDFKQIIRVNNLLATFLGWKQLGPGTGEGSVRFLVPNLFPHANYDETDIAESTGEIEMDSVSFHFHSSYDWLLAVARRIEKIKFADSDGTTDIHNYAYLRTFYGNMARINRYCLHQGKDLKQSLLMAVVEFIERYYKNDCNV